MYLGIDIGGTNLKVGVFDESFKIIQQFAQSTNAVKGVDYVLNSVKRIINVTVEKYPTIESVGIGIPGIVTADGMVKISPNMPEFVDVPIGKYFSNSFTLPIFVDNDANIAALAEMELGAAKGLRNFIYVTMGTGVGGAIVLDRKVYKGENYGAGEIGFMIYDPFLPVAKKNSFRTGIFEEYLGKNQIAVYAKKYIQKHPYSLLHQMEKTDPYFISEAANKGDETALDIFTQLGYIFGVSLTSAFNLLDIKVAVVGGGLSAAHEVFYKSAVSTIKKRALPTIAPFAEVRQAKFTKDSGIIGAAILAKTSVQ